MLNSAATSKSCREGSKHGTESEHNVTLLRCGEKTGSQIDCKVSIVVASCFQ